MRCKGAASSGARGAGRVGETDGVGDGWTVLWEGGSDGGKTREGGDAGVGGAGEAYDAGTAERSGNRVGARGSSDSDSDSKDGERDEGWKMRRLGAVLRG